MKKKGNKKLLTAYGLTVFGCVCAVLLGIGIVTAGGNTRAVSFGDSGTTISVRRAEEDMLRVRMGERSLTLDGGPLREAAEALAPTRFLLPAPLSDTVWLIDEAEALVEEILAMT